MQEAQRASGSSVLRFVTNTRRLMYVGLGAALWALAIVRVVQHSKGPDAFLFFLMGGAALFAYGYLPWRRDRRALAAAGETDIMLKADENVIEVTAANSSYRGSWNDVQRWFETGNCIALLMKNRRLIVVPKRVLPAQELDLFREQLRRKLNG
jgi:hypothetical protein